MIMRLLNEGDPGKDESAILFLLTYVNLSQERLTQKVTKGSIGRLGRSRGKGVIQPEC